MKSLKLGASLLSASPLEWKELAMELVQSGIDFFHMDIMDGNFVPNLALNSSFCVALHSLAPTIPMDIHFMTTEKALHSILPSFFESHPKWITFHHELGSCFDSFFQLCIKNGVSPGLAINPSTPIDELVPFLPYCTMVLLMSVNPGHGGQKFQEESYERLNWLVQWRKRNSATFLIEVDGGITLPISKELAFLGADMIVIGSQLIFQEDKKAFIHLFHQLT